MVDSSPHRYNGGDAVEDRLGHGHAMGRIIRELGCPDESALCIAQVANYLVVRDLGSTNGIRINGVRVLEGRLQPGDELTIGNARFQVRWEEAVAGPAGAQPAALEPAQLADDLLEGCDDPVPLHELDESRLPRSRAKTVLPKDPPAGPPAPVQLPPEAAPPSPPILPEHLDLAPDSAPWKFRADWPAAWIGSPPRPSSGPR